VYVVMVMQVRLTDRRRDSQTDTETHRQMQRLTVTDRCRDSQTTETHRQTQRLTDRHRDSQTDTETHR